MPSVYVSSTRLMMSQAVWLLMSQDNRIYTGIQAFATSSQVVLARRGTKDHCCVCSLVRLGKQISTGISFRKLHARFYATDLWTSRGMQSSSLAVRLNPVRPVAITFQIPFDLNLKEKNYFQRRKHRNMFSLQCPSKLCEFRTWSWMFTWILTNDWSFRGPYSLSAPSIIWKKNFFCFSKVPSWRFGK